MAFPAALPETHHRILAHGVILRGLETGGVMANSQSTVSFKSYGGNAPENYERYFVPAIGEPLAVDLVDAAALGRGEAVLDVACGTGIVARLAAERVGKTGRAAGLDMNAGMLQVARSLPASSGIEWHEANAQDLPMLDHTFDVVTCQLGLMFFPDKPAALREMRRVLKPAGRLLANLPGPTPDGFAILEQALARHLSPDAARFVGQVFSLYDPAEISELIETAGFSSVDVETSLKALYLGAPVDFLWRYVTSTPLVAAVSQMDDEGRAALEHDVVSGWQGLLTDEELVIQLPIVTVKARA
jgi:ubiquinone/menaquinone biosynthesis C-methylase UbiE